MAEEKRILSLTEMSRRPLSQEVIPGVLDEGVVLLVGKEGHYKTFLACRMAMHVACGVPWLGQTVERGLVIYCIAEGASFFTYRVTTLVDQMKMWMGLAQVYIYPHSFSLMATPSGEPNHEMVQFMERVHAVEDERKEKCRLLVIDTLSRFMPGGDENDQAAASGVVKNVEWLREQVGGCILLLHHMRKGGDMVRGSTVFTAAADQVIIGKSAKEDKLQLFSTKEGGKRKDRDGVDIWVRMDKVAMTIGRLAEEIADSEFDEPSDWSDHYIFKSDGNPEETLVAVPVEKPEDEDAAKGTAAGDIAIILKKGEPVGIRQLMRLTGKGQNVVYKALDKMVDAGHVTKDLETKRYSWVGPVEPVNPFEGGAK